MHLCVLNNCIPFCIWPAHFTLIYILMMKMNRAIWLKSITLKINKCANSCITPCYRTLVLLKLHSRYTSLQNETFFCLFSGESEVSLELNVVFLRNGTESFLLIWTHRCFAAHLLPLKRLSAAGRLKKEYNIILYIIFCIQHILIA